MARKQQEPGGRARLAGIPSRPRSLGQLRTYRPTDQASRTSPEKKRWDAAAGKAGLIESQGKSSTSPESTVDRAFLTATAARKHSTTQM
jgi:hypothetical protein